MVQKLYIMFARGLKISYPIFKMTKPILNTFMRLGNRRIGAIFLLGFSSGLPLALTGGTLQAWMATEGVDLKTIGIFTLVGTPYTLKFLWAPVMDRFIPPFLGRRRGWILIAQIVLAVLILCMGTLSPKDAAIAMGLVAFLIAFVSASQDIVIDAYRTDVLLDRERGFGAAISVTGYRIAMLVSGAMALVLSESLGWKGTYMLMVLFLIVGVVGTFVGPPAEMVNPPKSLYKAIKEPWVEFFSRRGAWAVLALIILYKLGDAFAGSLTTAFLIRGAGFSVGEVGIVNKGMGLGATILGVLAGGFWMAEIGLYRSLMFFGILQAISNLSFVILALIGKNYTMMIFAVGFENLAGGMGTAAFLAFLMALCDRRFTATQFALLSALASLGRVFVGPPSGYLAMAVGWPTFFLTTLIASLPGLIMLKHFRKTIQKMESEHSVKEKL